MSAQGQAESELRKSKDEARESEGKM